MRRIKTIAVIALCGFLSACITPYAKKDADVEFHPSWPSPVETPVLEDVRVMPDPNNPNDVVVVQSLSEWFKVRIFLEDVKRYMRDSREMVCFYRKNVKGDYCYVPKI